MKKIMLLLVVALSATILTANNAHAYDGVNRDSNGNITEVDLNGDVFVDGDYSAATWEINLEDMATDPYYKNAAIALPLQFVPMLEIKNKIFHFYKSLFVKYDAKLTSELILLLLAYETAMDELMIEQQNNAQSYYEKAIGYSIELILTKKLDKLAPVVQIFLDENMVMASVEVTMDNVIDAIADSIYDTENIEDPYTKFIVELVKGIGVETVQDFSHKSLGELVSSTGKNLGNLIIDTLVSQILSLPETLITQHPLGKLAFAAIYWMMGQEAQYAAEQYALILDNITAFLTALLNPYNMGKNIRFDYLIEHNINTNTISWSENYVEQEGFIANKHRGMAITFADTDVIYRNISSSYGVTNFTRDPDKYVQVKGRINLLNESQMYSEINNLFDKQYRAHNSNPNKFIFSSGYTERYYENRYTGIRYYAGFNLVRTPFRIKNADLSNAPTQTLYPSNYSTGYKVDITDATNKQNYKSGILRVFNNSTLIYEYNLSGSVQQILVPDLIHGKIYRFEIYVEYEMNFFITNNYRVYQREFTYLKSSGGGGGGGPKPPIQELMY